MELAATAGEYDVEDVSEDVEVEDEIIGRRFHSRFEFTSLASLKGNKTDNYISLAFLSSAR